MGTHWTDKRCAVAMVGAALRERGWKLWGWKEDRSDSMTDYYDPESWEGVAEKDGAVVCVDVGAYRASQSGQLQGRHVSLDGPCSSCQGTGKEPRDVDLPGSTLMPIFGGEKIVEPPVHYRAGEPCHHCKGTGRRVESRQDPEAPRWPVFQANPKGSTWHVEREGRIIAKGSGVFSVSVERYKRDGRPKLDALVDRIERAAQGRATPGAAATVDRVTLRPSSTGKEGFVEVVFPEKPDEAVRAELKGAGFRWSRFNGCWYGPEAALPEAVRKAVAA